MQRVTRSTAVAVQPAVPASPGPPGFFTGGNPGGGVPATIPGYEWFNGVQEELIAVIARAGLTPAAADLAQMRQALDRLYGGGLRSVAANTTLTAADAGLVLVDASGGNRTITLPAANAAGGRPIRLHLIRSDSSANTVTIQRAGTDTIEGATSLALTLGARLSLVSDGTAAWLIVAGDVAASPAVGAVKFIVGNAAPPGWLKANGALVSRASFPRLWAHAQASGALFSELAWLTDSWGGFSVGDGSTTFRLPDLRGEFLRGWDDGRGVDTSRALGVFQFGAIQSHTHGVTDPGHVHSYTRIQAKVDTDRGTTSSTWSVDDSETVNTASATTGISIQSTGGTETRPRNVALLACIRF